MANELVYSSYAPAPASVPALLSLPLPLQLLPLLACHAQCFVGFYG